MLKSLLFNGPLRNEAGGGEGGGGASGGTAGGEGATGGAAGGAEGASGAATGLLGDDLSFTEGWQGKVGEHAEGLTFKNLPEMAKSAKETRAKVTELSQANADLTAQLEAKTGEIPKTAEEFSKAVTLPTELPEGIEVPPTLVDAGIEFALSKGYSPQVVSDFIEFQVQQAANEYDAEKNDILVQTEQAKATVMQAVGPQEYDKTISDAKAANEAMGLNLDAETLVTNPTLIIALSKIHEQISPGTLKGVDMGGSQGADTSAQGKLSQAEAILTDTTHKYHKAFFNSDDPLHDTAVAEHNRLILESGGG